MLARHSSGRPWLVGRRPARGVRAVDVESGWVAVLGDCLASPAELAASARRGVDQMLRLPGSFHTVATGPAGLVAAGDAAGFRRVFTAEFDGLQLAASHADVARRLIGAEVDRVWLAARLTSPEMPSVLRETLAPFTGVRPVAAGCCVELSGQSRRVRRWWAPPPADQTLRVGAERLRHTLTEAVSGRLDQAPGRVSVQLSGGLDSATLAVLAERAGPLLVTTAGRSRVDDDLGWARRVAAHLPECVHRVVDPGKAPCFFAELGEPVPGMDEPAPFAAAAARQRYTADLLAKQDIGLHLNGQGGDEVLLPTLAYLRSALAAEPRTGWRHLRGHAALKNIPLWTLARAVVRRESYPAWLARAAGTLGTEASAAWALTGWEAPPLLPPWATSEACELVRTAITSAAPAPLDDDPAVHAAVVRIRASAYRAALYRDAMQAAEVPTAMPFFDRPVLEACLAVRPWERVDPWQPKPLLRAAFADIVPAQLLARRTKGHYNADIHHGWSAHRDRLAGLLDRPLLAEQYGLIDPAALRRALAGFGPSGLPPAWVTDVVAVERWLRDLTPPPSRSLR